MEKRQAKTEKKLRSMMDKHNRVRVDTPRGTILKFGDEVYFVGYDGKIKYKAEGKIKEIQELNLSDKKIK
ncbi:MAG: hypothetical protein ACOC5T_01655 [Elusimicrobiota bacterium]